MRALLIHQFGEPSLLKIEEVPTPAPRGDEVLVAVKAAAINPSDVKNVAGTMHGTTLPRIPGRDFAGTVVAGPPELMGKDVFGTGGDIGFTRDGSHAQFILLPAAGVAIKPAALPMLAAGAAGVAFVTAWSALVSAAALSAGETILIIGAAGGVGSAAVQIAVARRARVIGVVASDDDREPARRNGALDIINSSSVGVVDAVRSMTGNRGADVVFDTSGWMFAQSIESAAPEGRIPVITSPPDGNATFNLRSVYRKMLRIVGVDTRALDAVACARLLTEMLPSFESGAFKPAPGESRPLAEGVAAYQQAARGGARIVLRPDL
jgi:NADPH2:quinone reductase